jgi:hypothetical protein
MHQDLIRYRTRPEQLAVRAFGEFQAGLADRCEQLPVREQLTAIGSYRMFG